MLADNCHVSIGGYHYLVDESIDHSANPEGGSLFRPHYRHWYQQLMGDRSAIIVGAPNTKDLRPERLIWSYNDWVAGEGNRTFQPTDPYVYDFAYGVNPRIRGQITGRPNRTLTSFTTDDQRNRGAFAMGNNALWIGQSATIAYSTDGTTWTAKTANLTAGERITAVAGDSEWFYYSGWSSAASGTRDLNAVSTAAAGGTAVVASATGKSPFAGLATMHGRLYGWTGRKLWEYDVFNAFPLITASQAQVRKAGDSGVDPASTNVFGTSWWANCVAAETSVFCFYTTDGQSTVFEFQLDGGLAPIWICPYGLSIKSMQYANGILYMAGHWGGDSNNSGRGVLYAMPLDTRRPVFVDWIRKQNNMNLQMQEMSSSYGSQVMLAAARTGRIFIYDADMDGLSNLDDIATSGGGGAEANAPRIPATDTLTFTENDHRIADMVTYGTKRIIQVYRPGAGVAGTTIQLLAYDDDEPTNLQASTVTGNAVTKLEVGNYDFDMPFDQKVLNGFDVLFKPLTTGQSFQLEYSIDGGTYVALTAVDWTSGDAAKGRTFINVSTSGATVKFGRMRWRLTLTGARQASVDYKPPIVYNVTAECMLMTYDEMWDLVLRFKDEKQRTRMSSHQVKGSTLRDFLFTSANNKTVLAFVDGYVYTDPGHTKASVDVVIDQIEDIAIRHGEGSCKIRLRKVPA